MKLRILEDKKGEIEWDIVRWIIILAVLVFFLFMISYLAGEGFKPNIRAFFKIF